MYLDHSTEVMPIIARGASSRHCPPVCSTSSLRALFQTDSESSSTPSRSKITAAGRLTPSRPGSGPATARGWTRGAPSPATPSVARLVLERDPEANAVAADRPVLDRHVLPEDLGDAQVAHRLGRRLDRVARGRLPGLVALPDHLGDAVNALSHQNRPLLDSGMPRLSHIWLFAARTARIGERRRSA